MHLSVTRHGKLPTPSTGRSSTSADPYYYSGYGEVNVTNGTYLAAVLSIHSPFLDSRDYHTLAEVAAADTDSQGGIYNTAEAGWTVDPSDFSGSSTRLFVYAGLAGYSNPVCYPGSNQGSCGWVQVSAAIKPGDVLPTQNGSHQTFQLVRNSRGWEVYYGYYDVGYFQNAWYALSGDGFGSATYWAWYGEVSSNLTGGTCSDMGDGLPASSVYAAYESNLTHTDQGHGPLTALGPSTGYSLNLYNRNPAAFRYGGAGVC